MSILYSHFICSFAKYFLKDNRIMSFSISARFTYVQQYTVSVLSGLSFFYAKTTRLTEINHALSKTLHLTIFYLSIRTATTPFPPGIQVQ